MPDHMKTLTDKEQITQTVLDVYLRYVIKPALGTSLSGMDITETLQVDAPYVFSKITKHRLDAASVFSTAVATIVNSGHYFLVAWKKDEPGDRARTFVIRRCAHDRLEGSTLQTTWVPAVCRPCWQTI